MPQRIAVDAMGGDEAPGAVVKGAARAARSAEGALELLLFGPEQQVSEALQDCEEDASALPVRVVDAPEVIGMGEAPTEAVKQKPKSSIHRGLGACKEGRADAFASAGNTGALMAASLFILGRLPGVDRPTMMSMVPTLEGQCLLMDVGTNVDCRPAHLVQFARMGTVCAERLEDCEAPTVGLLNVGEEPGKGNEQTRKAYELLEQQPSSSDLHFAGNVEGHDVLAHAADVVVCDGFIGNIILKFGESIATTLLREMVRREIKRQDLSREQAAAVQSVLDGVQEPFDYEARGGVPLLGVDGTVLVGHGGSSPHAVERMIFAAADVAGESLPEAIAAAFEDAPDPAS
jgi:glycerol-3-phosphate acyltransferase PlsX